MTVPQLPEVLHRGMAILLVGIGIGLATMHTLLAAFAAERASLSQSKRFFVSGLVGAYLITWLAVGITFGDPINFPLGREQLRLPISLLVAFGPMFLGIAALFLSDTLRRVNGAMPTTWLIWAQTYRVAGLMFLFPYLYYGILPAGFAVPAGIGDFLIGVLTPVVALAVARRQPYAFTWAVAWNLFGILDLTVAPVAAFVSRAAIIGMYPLSLVPLFIGVPMGVLAHVYSIRNLRIASASAASERVATAHAYGTLRAREM